MMWVCVYIKSHSNSAHQMDGRKPKVQGKLRQNKCGIFCCSCRLSVSLSEDVGSSEYERVNQISNLAHRTVQEKLDQIIEQRKSAKERRKKKEKVNNSKCIVMIATDRYSSDPKGDFRQSILELITSNCMERPNELRCLLNCYMSMNTEECRPLILQAFHEPPTLRLNRMKFQTRWRFLVKIFKNEDQHLLIAEAIGAVMFTKEDKFTSITERYRARS